ncbi:MAG: glucosylceramidase, partial [Clostridia bacterium]|nr:glucosylceramidase [Clostridia bacterium]
IKFLASPWSPPAFMKDTKEMNHGGKLLPEYKKAWASYIAKYIEEYKKEGIDISMLTVQNEPNATQRWDSCTYTAEEESDFGTNYLVPELEEKGLESVKVLFWDHNKDNVIHRAEKELKTKKSLDAFSGIAFHWYSGDHFEQIRMFKEKYPDKIAVFTEGCIEKHQFKTPVKNAERYAHDIIGNINGGMDAFIDWNLYLDENGGPNHVGNFCSAPIQGNTETDEIIYNPSYYYIGHFSKFIPVGSKRIGVSRFTDTLETVAFLTPDNERVVVVLNRSDNGCKFRLCEQDRFSEQTISPHTIKTYIYKI